MEQDGWISEKVSTDLPTQQFSFLIIPTALTFPAKFNIPNLLLSHIAGKPKTCSELVLRDLQSEQYQNH